MVSYWDRQPCNVKHSTLAVGTREYFDEVEWRKYFVEPHIPRFADFRRWRGKYVLELGCGIGTDAINFARAGAHVVAVDSSSESLQITWARAMVFGFSRWLMPLPHNIQEPIATPCKFDLIYSFGVLHHLDDPAACLQNVRPLLAPEGELRIMVYYRWSWKRLIIALGLSQPEAQDDCPKWRTWSKRGIQRLLQQTGYTVEQMFVTHIFPWKIKEYKNYEYVKAWPWRWMPEWLFGKLEGIIGWHLCVVARRSDV